VTFREGEVNSVRLYKSVCVESEDTTLAYQEFQGDAQGPL